MKKAIFIRMTGILLLALLVSSWIACYFAGKQMLVNTEQDMKAAMHLLDQSLDYEKDLQEQVMDLQQKAWTAQTRITVITAAGEVRADTGSSQVEDMENHLEREEVQAALRDGIGYSSRYSQTLGRHMLYGAILSEQGSHIIRIAIPYSGVFDYVKMVLPAILTGLALIFLISVMVFSRLTDGIIGPLQEITGRMKLLRENNYEAAFPDYAYEELNVIAKTTTQMAAEIKEHLEQVEKEKKVRQEFFSNVSHELKTPITSVKGYAELLDRGFVKDEATEKDFIRRILKEAENMTTLIDDILMISRLESREARVVFSMVKMDVLLREVVQSIEPVAAGCGVSLETHCEPVVIEAGAKQLRELLSNLVTNAVKYNRPGGHVWIRIGQEEETLVIRVKDDGVGIAPEDMERIFERFYRVDKGRSRRQGGTGLGLSIVKHIVEFYHGSVKVHSKINEGSEFIVRIPVKNQEYQ